MPLPPLTTPLRRRGLAVFVGLAMAGNVQAADLWTITQDALANDASLAAARANFQSVEASRDVVRGGLLPQVSLTGEISHSRDYNRDTRGVGGSPDFSSLPPEQREIAQAVAGSLASGGGQARQAMEDNVTAGTVGVQATQTLYDAVNNAQLDEAQQRIAQQALSLTVTEQQLLLAVSEAYLEILRANDVLSARRAQETAIERQLEQARERFEVGLIAITDVHEAQATYDLARAQRIAAEGALQVSFEALERLTGHRYDTISTLSEEAPIEGPQPVDREEWVRLALAHSPEVLMAEAGIEVARSTVEVARAGHQPGLSAFARYDWTDTDVSGADYDSGSVIGLSANLPLYTGGRTQAQVRQNSFLLEASQYDFEAQRRNTVQQVRSQFTLVNNSVEAVEARRQAIISNQSALEATRSGYEVGTRNIVDVLNAEQNLFNAIAEHAEARYDYVLSLLRLQQQAGLLGPDSIQAINAWLDEGETVSLQLPDESNSDPVMNIGARPQAPTT